jgi:hypothetical protein
MLMVHGRALMHRLGAASAGRHCMRGRLPTVEALSARFAPAKKVALID